MKRRVRERNRDLVAARGVVPTGREFSQVKILPGCKPGARDSASIQQQGRKRDEKEYIHTYICKTIKEERIK